MIREIAQGACKIGIGNTVALAQLRDGREGADWRAWAMEVKAVPTTFKGGGTHVNLTGAAIAKHAPHPALARQFLEFLVTPAAQRIFAAAELEYPVLATAERAPIVAEMGIVRSPMQCRSTRSPHISRPRSRLSRRRASMSRVGHNIKAVLLQVHSIAGLVLALLLALIALTGAIMSFEDEIGDYLNAASCRSRRARRRR